MGIVETLKQNPVFNCLTVDELESLVERASVHHYHKYDDEYPLH